MKQYSSAEYECDQAPHVMPPMCGPMRVGYQCNAIPFSGTDVYAPPLSHVKRSEVRRAEPSPMPSRRQIPQCLATVLQFLDVWSATDRIRGGRVMRYGKLMVFGILASALLGGACNRADEPRDTAVREETTPADAAAKRQQER